MTRDHGASDCSAPGLTRRRQGRGSRTSTSARAAPPTPNDRERIAGPGDPAGLARRLDLPRSARPHPGDRHRRRGPPAVPATTRLARAARSGEVRRDARLRARACRGCGAGSTAASSRTGSSASACWRARSACSTSGSSGSAARRTPSRTRATAWRRCAGSMSPCPRRTWSSSTTPPSTAAPGPARRRPGLRRDRRGAAAPPRRRRRAARLQGGPALARRPLRTTSTATSRSPPGSTSSAKDFRTWNATVLAAVSLAVVDERRRPRRAAKRAIRWAVEQVAAPPRQHPGGRAARPTSTRASSTGSATGWTIERSLATLGEDDGSAIQGPIERAVIRLLDLRVPRRVPPVHRRFRLARRDPGQPRLRARRPRDPRGRRGRPAARADRARRAPSTARGDAAARAARLRDQASEAGSLGLGRHPRPAAPPVLEEAFDVIGRFEVRRADRPLRAFAVTLDPATATCSVTVRGAAQPVRRVSRRLRGAGDPHNGIAIADESHLELPDPALGRGLARDRYGARPARSSGRRAAVRELAGDAAASGRRPGRLVGLARPRGPPARRLLARAAGRTRRGAGPERVSVTRHR